MDGFNNKLEDKMLKSEFKNVPELSEKMLVDLINGLEVSSGQIKYRDQQDGFSRFIGFCDGSNRRRDSIISMQHQHSLENLTSWAIELTRDGRHTTETLMSVINTLNDVRKTLNDTIMFSVENRHIIEHQENKLQTLSNYISNKISTLESEVRRVEIKTDAHLHLTSVTEGWKSGRLFYGYPLIVQTCLVLHELYHGHQAGHILFSEKKYIKTVIDTTVNVLYGHFNIKNNTYHSIRNWLKEYNNSWESISNNIETPLRKEVTCYLFGNNENKPIQKLLSDYTLSSKFPDGVENDYKRRESGMYDTPQLIETILNEVGT